MNFITTTEKSITVKSADQMRALIEGSRVDNVSGRDTWKAPTGGCGIIGANDEPAIINFELPAGLWGTSGSPWLLINCRVKFPEPNWCLRDVSIVGVEGNRVHATGQGSIHRLSVDLIASFHGAAIELEDAAGTRITSCLFSGAESSCALAVGSMGMGKRGMDCENVVFNRCHAFAVGGEKSGWLRMVDCRIYNSAGHRGRIKTIEP